MYVDEIWQVFVDQMLCEPNVCLWSDNKMMHWSNLRRPIDKCVSIKWHIFVDQMFVDQMFVDEMIFDQKTRKPLKVPPTTNDYKLHQGTLTEGEGSVLDLLIRVACFVTPVNDIFKKKMS